MTKKVKTYEEKFDSIYNNIRKVQTSREVLDETAGHIDDLDREIAQIKQVMYTQLIEKRLEELEKDVEMTTEVNAIGDGRFKYNISVADWFELMNVKEQLSNEIESFKLNNDLKVLLELNEINYRIYITV